MQLTSILLLALNLSIAVARNCRNITIQVSIESRNAEFSLSPAQCDSEVADFLLSAAQQGHNITTSVLTGYKTVKGQYDIAATYCTPDGGPGKAIQLLTHGIGFDRSYWDLSFNNHNYSYVDQALAAGYSTLSHDRLGLGQSSRGHPVHEIQAPLEIAALKSLTEALRDGTCNGILQKFEYVFHVGHSFGAIQTSALARLYPQLSSGLILQGFGHNATFVPYFLFGGNFVAVQGTPRASEYPAGYLDTASMMGTQQNFFSPGQYDPRMLDYAFHHGQPVTQGELLTLTGSAGGVNHFRGPVFIITGSRDLPFCGGDCFQTGDPELPSIMAASAHAFPDVNRFEVDVVPEAGHGMNMEYSHSYTYQQMLRFLDDTLKDNVALKMKTPFSPRGGRW